LPHSGQRPSHFDDWLPHSWQAKIVRGPFVVFTSARNYRVGLRQLPVAVTTIGSADQTQKHRCLTGR